MKITGIKRLVLPEIKVIEFARFRDDRGYFLEHYRKSDMFNNPELGALKKQEFVQANQSFSKKGVIRGLHFQWNPYMGKLVRALSGHMIDLVLDIRTGSPTFGKAIGYSMPTDTEKDKDEWIWVPPGFAHGNFFLEDSTIEYFCTGEYSSGCEAGISPVAADIDWSLCDRDLKKMFDEVSSTTDLITDKDKHGPTLEKWLEDERSQNFVYTIMAEQKIF